MYSAVSKNASVNVVNKTAAVWGRWRRKKEKEKKTEGKKKAKRR